MGEEAGFDGLQEFWLGGIGEVDDGGVARHAGELVGVGDEHFAVVIEECEADGREAVRGEAAQVGVRGVVLECGGVEDEDVVVVARGDVEGAAVGGDGFADGAAAGVEEPERGVALMLRAVVGGRGGGFEGVDDEEAAAGVWCAASGVIAVAVLQVWVVESGKALGECGENFADGVEAGAVGREGDALRGAQCVESVRRLRGRAGLLDRGGWR